MRSNDGHRSGRRSGRRGSRRRQSGGGGSGNSAPKTTVKKKQSLIERILGFFKRGTKAPQSSSRPAATTSSYRPQQSARPARKPEAMEVISPKLYVGNLSYDATESDLFDLFKGVGSVQNAEVVSHKATMKSKGFGFVTMSTVDEAKRAVEILHDKEFMGRKLVVSGAKTSDVRYSSSSASSADVGSEQAA